MTYNTIATMARDGDLQQRFVACAAQEAIANPDTWVLTNIWALVAAPGLADSYQSALDGLTVDQNPRIGMRDDVITDSVVLSTVQSVHATNP